MNFAQALYAFGRRDDNLNNKQSIKCTHKYLQQSLSHDLELIWSGEKSLEIHINKIAVC